MKRDELIGSQPTTEEIHPSPPIITISESKKEVIIEKEDEIKNSLLPTCSNTSPSNSNITTTNNNNNNSKQRITKTKKKKVNSLLNNFFSYLHRELLVSSKISTHIFSNKSDNAEEKEKNLALTNNKNLESSSHHLGKPYNPPNSIFPLSFDPNDSRSFYTSQQIRTNVYNFIDIPIILEKFLFFGFFICLDVFLFYFTIFPLRILFSFFSSFFLFISTILKYLKNKIFNIIEINESGNLNYHLLFDILKFICLISTVFLIIKTIDYSLLYHYVRGESILKLYMIYSMLDVFDKLCNSFGLDCQLALFGTMKDFIENKNFSKIHMFIIFTVYNIYLYIHSIVTMIRMITLNVALNSSNYALLTMIISTNFVELKGSVFKRFTKENLFQLLCSDIVERFELFWFSMLIFIQNTVKTATIDLMEHIEIHSLNSLNNNNGTSPIVSFYHLNNTNAFKCHIISEWNNNSSGLIIFERMEEMINIFLFMIISEMLVDALKHTFICKFNGIPISIFNQYKLRLCADLIPQYSDQLNNSISSSTVTSAATTSVIEGASFFDNVNRTRVCRRIGFVESPIIIHTLRVIIQVLLPYFFLVVQSCNFIVPLMICVFGALILFLCKVLLSIVVIGHAAKRLTNKLEDEIISFFPNRYMMFDKRIP
ncbi:hypothetical protein ABK040_002434 [Willaertia magna]